MFEYAAAGKESLDSFIGSCVYLLQLILHVQTGHVQASLGAGTRRAIAIVVFIVFLARQASGRQFLMINNIDMNENPGDVEAAEPGEDAQSLMARYMEHMLPALLARACHPVMIGNAVYPAIDVIGIEGAAVWDQGGVVRYRSRRTFLDIVTNPVFGGKHHFKTAALEKTIAFPIETGLYLSDLRLLLGLVLLAITALLDALWLSRRNSRA